MMAAPLLCKTALTALVTSAVSMLVGTGTTGAAALVTMKPPPVYVPGGAILKATGLFTGVGASTARVSVEPMAV